MFLLNIEVGLDWDYSQTTFTIQNVPIKRRIELYEKILWENLQYKMFLLNIEEKYGQKYSVSIYNTKCSY